MGKGVLRACQSGDHTLRMTALENMWYFSSIEPGLAGHTQASTFLGKLESLAIMFSKSREARSKLGKCTDLPDFKMKFAVAS